jgi:g-D-glutamyl-meso-diaminopimelate peptidase
MRRDPAAYICDERTTPYNSIRLNEELVILRTLFPFIKVEQIGSSVLGQPIFHLMIGKGKKIVHMNASFHANEWITTNVLMRFVKEYAESVQTDVDFYGKEARTLYKNVTLSIVPMVNPDGVNLVVDGPASIVEPYRSFAIYTNKDFDDFQGWKANIRGVDLNKQFPANWEKEAQRKMLKGPHPRDFGGDYPMSEPEVLCMSCLTERLKPNLILALHTQGKEFYWGYMEKEPLESVRIAAEFERVSPYRSVRNIDSYAGYKDWFILKWNKPGFTIELGKGINPLPLSQFSSIYNECIGILVASMYMV